VKSKLRKSVPVSAYWHTNHVPSFGRIKENCKRSSDLKKKFSDIQSDGHISHYTISSAGSKPAAELKNLGGIVFNISLDTL